MPPFDTTISRAEARRVYNTLGAGLDRAARYEGRARRSALDALDLHPDQRALQIGVGTGGEQLALARAVGAGGQVVGLDLSRTMLMLTRRTSDTPLCEGDAVALPFAAQSFDRLFCAYVLDLLPAADLPRALAEFARVLRPDGRAALVSLTEGITPTSRLFVAAWNLRFRRDARAMGGCRPLQLLPLVERAGLAVVRREVIVQRGFPSEVVVAKIARSAGDSDPIPLARAGRRSRT